MVKLRLKRMGQKFNAFYRIVAADARAPRDGRFIEEIGYYNPHTKEVFVNNELKNKWLEVGAVPSDTVRGLFKKYNSAKTDDKGVATLNVKAKTKKVVIAEVKEVKPVEKEVEADTKAIEAQAAAKAKQEADAQAAKAKQEEDAQAAKAKQEADAQAAKAKQEAEAKAKEETDAQEAKDKELTDAQAKADQEAQDKLDAEASAKADELEREAKALLAQAKADAKAAKAEKDKLDAEEQEKTMILHREKLAEIAAQEAIEEAAALREEARALRKKNRKPSVPAMKYRIFKGLIAEESELSMSRVTLILKELVDTISEATKNDKKIVIAGFGTFERTFRKGRKGINPLTMEPLEIPSKNVPKFKASKTFKDIVNDETPKK